MTTYTTLPQDDSNLDVTLTESNDLVTLDINPASVSVSGAVNSVNGLSGDVLLTTDLIPEGTNKYYTDAKFDTAFSTKTTDDLTQGITNLYYSDTLVDAHLTGGTGVTYTAGDISIGQPVGTTDDVTFNSVTGDMFGVQHFTAKAREAISAGQPVYISGHSGNTPEVMVADYTDPLKMPAFGIASTDIANNNNGSISTYGDLKNVDTTGSAEGETWAVGDDLYVNGSKLTNMRPSLPSQQIQKVAKVIRVSANVGQMFLTGAGRANDTPNLATNNVFIGNSGGVERRQLTYTDILNTPDLSPYATTTYVNALPVSTFTNDAGYLTSTALTPYYTSAQVNALPVSTFSNDAGYLTSETDSQTLSFANPNLSISNGNSVDLSALTPTSLAWSAITSTPTTLSGYGIVDGYTDADAITALETATDITMTGNLTVNGDFVVLEQVKINNFEFPLTNAGRTDQWPTNTYTLNAANAYTKFQLRTNDPVIIFDTSDFFDDVNNLRTIYIQVDYRGGNGGIDWPANVIWDNQTEPNFATGGNDRHIVVMTGNGTNGWFAYVEQVVNPANPSSVTGKLSHYKITDVGDITDGTAGQVLSTNADGTFSFVDQSGGGGGGALEDLTDVGILNLQNNDLLMYNSTASEWQNTNLGVSVTPILSGDATITAGNDYTVTITNHATYDQPAYFCEVYDGATLVVANSAVTDNLDGTLTFASPAAVGTYQIRVKAQDFGDLQSENGTLDFDAEPFGGTYQYFRFSNIVGASGNNIGLINARFYSTSGQTGTAYPANMTSTNTPTPYVVSQSYQYSTTYAGWKAYDTYPGNTWWWLLSSSNVNGEYLDIDMGSAVSISSMTVGPWWNQSPTSIDVYASTTGAFAGEEVLLTTAVFNNGPASTVLNIG